MVFICTNYNNSNFTKMYLNSIIEAGLSDAPVVVVDNDSDIESVQELKLLASNNENVHLILNDKNVGYFPGLNIGIEYARKNFTEAELFVIGNNDIMLDRGFVNSVNAARNLFTNYPVVSPNIKMLDGSPQNPHVVKGISRFREMIYDIYHSNYFFAGLIVKLAKLTAKFTDRSDERQHMIAQEIYQGYGACYILTPKFFQNFDALWSPSFLMYEEFFLTKQLEGEGFKIYYEPSIVVTHHCHASTGKLPARLKWQYSKEAHKIYRKYVKVWR